MTASNFIEHKPQYTRYVWTLLSVLLVMMTLVGAVNFIVDPYGLWRVAEIEGFNAAKSERREQNYLFKAADLINQQPEVMLMGSSRAAFGLNPAHPVFAEQGYAGVYNAALTGGHLYAQRRYIEHAIHNNPKLKLIIWGVDFFAFAESVGLPASFDDNRLGVRQLPVGDVVNALWSLDAFQASAATVMSNMRRPYYQPYYANGQLTAMDMAEQVQRKGMMHRFEQSLRLYLNHPTRFKRYKPSQKAWQDFETTLKEAKEAGIEVRLFISPVHLLLLEAMKARGVYTLYTDWVDRISALPAFYDVQIGVDVRAEKLADEMSFYWDVSHYRQNVGDQVLASVLTSHSSSSTRQRADDGFVQGVPLSVNADDTAMLKFLATEDKRFMLRRME